MDWLTALLLGITLLVIFGLGYLGYHLFKKSKNSTKDLKDKDSAPLGIAKRFAAMRQFAIINPANIAKDGKFADLDFIMVGFFGVLGVKCIGRGGEIYGSVGDAMWLQVAENKRTSFENPMKTAQADGRVIRDTLFAAGMKNVPVEVVCVFTNKRATLALPRSTGHFTVKDFKSYLSKEKFEQDKGIDVEKTTAAIKTFIV